MEQTIPDYQLFVRYQAEQSPAILDEIMQKYNYITEILSRRFAGKGLEYDDIYQSASIGLMHAAKRFDPDRGIRFSTFATPTVLGEIKRLFRDKGSCIRVPRRMYEIFSKVNKIRNEELVKTGKMPSSQELSDTLGISREQLYEVMYWGDTREIHSLEQTMGEQDAMLSDCLGVLDHEYLMIENKDFINDFMQSLTEQERTFVRYRFYEEMTQQEIAKRLGISQMTVSRMEKKVLDQLRKLYHQTVVNG